MSLSAATLCDAERVLGNAEQPAIGGRRPEAVLAGFETAAHCGPQPRVCPLRLFVGTRLAAKNSTARRVPVWAPLLRVTSAARPSLAAMRWLAGAEARATGSDGDSGAAVPGRECATATRAQRPAPLP